MKGANPESEVIPFQQLDGVTTYQLNQCDHLCVPTLINWVKDSTERLLSGTFPFQMWLCEAAVQQKGNVRQHWGAVSPRKPPQNPDVFKPPFKH